MEISEVFELYVLNIKFPISFFHIHLYIWYICKVLNHQIMAQGEFLVLHYEWFWQFSSALKTFFPDMI